MNAIEISNQLNQPLPSGNVAYGLNHHAAALLRRQHEAIVKLREALENARIQYDYHGNPMEDCDRMVIAALADTEEI